MTSVRIKHTKLCRSLLERIILACEDSHHSGCSTSFSLQLNLLGLGAGQLGGDSLMALRIVCHTIRSLSVLATCVPYIVVTSLLDYDRQVHKF